MKVADLLKSFRLVALAREHLLPGAAPLGPRPGAEPSSLRHLWRLCSLRSILHTWLSHLIGFQHIFIIPCCVYMSNFYMIESAHLTFPLSLQ